MDKDLVLPEVRLDTLFERKVKGFLVPIGILDGGVILLQIFRIPLEVSHEIFPEQLSANHRQQSDLRQAPHFKTTLIVMPDIWRNLCRQKRFQCI